MAAITTPGSPAIFAPKIFRATPKMAVNIFGQIIAWGFRSHNNFKPNSCPAENKPPASSIHGSK